MSAAAVLSEAMFEALTDLVAADLVFDLSANRLRIVSNKIVLGSRSDEDFVEKASAQHAYDRAVVARRAALAKVQP